MALARATGIPHTVWLDDPRAMATAVRQIEDEHIKRKRGGK